MHGRVGPRGDIEDIDVGTWRPPVHNSLALSTPGPSKANLSLTQVSETLLQGTQLHMNSCPCAGKTGLCPCPQTWSYQGH